MDQTQGVAFARVKDNENCTGLVKDSIYIRGACSRRVRAFSHCVTRASTAHMRAASFKLLVPVPEPNPLLVRGEEERV